MVVLTGAALVVFAVLANDRPESAPNSSHCEINAVN
jgi:hypothetical protein